MHNRYALGIIFRTPEYGRVKKRLALEIGAEKTLSIYRAMLTTILKKVVNLKYIDIYGFYDGSFPEEAASRFSEIPLVHQKGKDLGERLYNAVDYLYVRGYGKIVLIGSDSPDLPPEYISETFSGLDSFDIVIGPSEDGGYYLIGMKKPVDFLFTDIPWGCPDVFKKTIFTIKTQGLSYYLLPRWYDIDDLKTLKRWLISVEDKAL